MIICSSGTTGLPKGVGLTHAMLLDNFTKFDDISSDDIVFAFSSLYWISGISILFGGIAAGAKRIITTDPFSPALFLRLVEKYRITNIFTSAFQITVTMKSELIDNADLSSVKFILAGGSKVPFESVERARKYLKNGSLSVGYGLSEIGGFISANYPCVYNETVGRVINGIKIKIVDDSGKRLGPNEVGEICALTLQKFGGYYNNPLATQELYDSEGFICSGDLGYFDEDGNLFVVDRKKDFVKYQNYMISPSEIESLLNKCPEIRSVCVVGIPDEISGDLPAAVVQLVEGKTISAEQIFNLVADNFIDQKKLRGGVYFVDSFPLTPSGKVLRRELKKLARESSRANNQC